MRDHILKRLATLADALVASRNTEERHHLSMAAFSLARTYHRVTPPAEGSP